MIKLFGFWGISHQRAYLDVRVFNPYAFSYRSSFLSSCFRRNEQQERRAYDQRVRDVEMGCFSPLVFSAVGLLRMLFSGDWFLALPLVRGSHTAPHFIGFVAIFVFL